ncbi:MAG TPA: glycolate oxidase subunit GlcE [Steroidobacteraceae bacterium]|nr:glycolate oxidase subunit GlcE [Steroidobacteraceae bacterium]
MTDMSSLQESIRSAAAARRPVRIRAGGSKDFYGGPLVGEPLDVGGLAGISDYESTELTVTAGAGTRLTQIERVLAERDQMLAFEPPRFAGRATLGGAIAAGLSGPRRAYCGALRDFVLGVSMIDGRGELLHFGGRVIKNVAGFDLSRLMAGSLGTLGLITEATVKVTPRPRAECTLRFAMDQASALESMAVWAARPLPLSATAWHDGLLHVRLSGAEAAVRAARENLGGEIVPGAEAYWDDVREQQLELFAAAPDLWRVSLPVHAPFLPIQGRTLIEWGGAVRWLPGPQDGSALRTLAARLGGHAMLYRASVKPAQGCFQPLPPAMLSLHRRLKAAFDPQGIFNRGRLHPDL